MKRTVETLQKKSSLVDIENNSHTYNETQSNEQTPKHDDLDNTTKVATVTSENHSIGISQLELFCKLHRR